MVYATLFFSWLAENNSYFEGLVKKRLFPEFGFEHGAEYITKARHREMANILKDNGLRCGVHLSYGNILCGHNNPAVWQKSLDKLCREAEIASWYEADHMIAHPSFHPVSDSWAASVGKTVVKEADFSSPSVLAAPGWLERSSRFWRKLMDINEAALYLENTHDQSPEAIVELLKSINCPQRAGMCFDLGHWFALAHGKKHDNLEQWLALIGNNLSHLHLHDNEGAGDSHLALGDGEINLENFLKLLSGGKVKPGFTLEAHSHETLRRSLEWIKKNQGIWQGFADISDIEY